LYLALTSSKKNPKKKIVWIFGANLFLNMLWTFLFFGLQRPVLAYFELILFWVSIWVLIFEVYSIDKKASLILIPYLLWVTFAGVLNYLSII
jgi:tryptophan-rich sensory protein